MFLNHPFVAVLDQFVTNMNDRNNVLIVWVDIAVKVVPLKIGAKTFVSQDIHRMVSQLANSALTNGDTLNISSQRKWSLIIIQNTTTTASAALNSAAYSGEVSQLNPETHHATPIPNWRLGNRAFNNSSRRGNYSGRRRTCRTPPCFWGHNLVALA